MSLLFITHGDIGTFGISFKLVLIIYQINKRNVGTVHGCCHNTNAPPIE